MTPVYSIMMFMNPNEISSFRSLAYSAGLSLANYLNEHPDPAIETYIRWAKAKRRPQPEAARALFTKPIKARLRHAPRRVLDIEGVANRDSLLLKLVDVSRWRLLHRMRECPKCQKWYFAEDDKQKFCGPNCRAAHFATHAGRERAGLRNRLWRIEKVLLPAVNKRIEKLAVLPRSKSVDARYNKAALRQADLAGEQEEIRAKLDQHEERTK
jgi:hypothetical protein